MDNQKTRIMTRSLAGIVLILVLTLLGSQSTFTQDFNREYGLGDIPLDPATYQKHLKVWAEAMLDALPSAYDARNDGIVTPAKDQGSCGSCWAFASVGAMESHLLKAYGVGPNDLAEQQQVSCNLSMYGCCGGSATAIRYWEAVGPLYESCFGYGDGGTSCPTYRTVPCSAASGCQQLPYRVIDWHTVSTTVDGFKTSLYTYGPSYWRYDVYDDFFTYWNYGSPGQVYVNQGGTLQGGHAVLLIGWDDSKGAYLCKNSWGESDGPNGDGTFWIAYSGHRRNLGFGMANFSLTQVGCSSNAECDDGLYCNGAETCVSSTCQAGTPPNCADDGLFCNGSEVCDEANDACGHTGDPCGAGTICDEEADQCNPVNCGNGLCEQGEDCTTCPDDCIGGSGGTCGACFKGVCDGVCHPVKEDATCSDCVSYCCGDGTCQGAENSYNCAVDCGPPPVCGDGTCNPEETQCGCPADCGSPPSTETSLCSNNIDDDCDTYIDCADPDCSDDPACACLPKGAVCATNGDCCSNKCRGGACR